MRIENRNYLRIKNRRLIQTLENIKMEHSHVEIEKTKSNHLTCKLKLDDRFNYVHSKYDPIKEADQLVANFELPEGKTHILLFGFGMGYHYPLLKEKYPNISFSIYEPSLELLKVIMDHLLLSDLFQGDHVPFFISGEIEEEIPAILKQHNNQIEVFSLPFHQNNYKEDLDQVYCSIIRRLQENKGDKLVNVAFRQRWTVNAIKNLPNVLETPNLLRDIYSDIFQDKPIILVSAGPSLADEYEQLRYIKKNRLAYIIAVGSANKALLANNIYPDAVSTYDPQAHNYQVFEPLLEQSEATIPMIYGTTVGYETVQKYKGPKFHVVTTQDTVTSEFTGEINDQFIVRDAPSIAVLTFEVFAKLNVKSIILVGQNFGFTDNLYYAKDIKRPSLNSAELQERDTLELMEVENVHGDLIHTNLGLNQMRLSLEEYITQYSHVKVINTTRSGAKINGTTFIPLEEWIDTNLNEAVVDPNWLLKYTKYKNVPPIKSTVNRINQSVKQFLSEFDELRQLIVQAKQKKALFTNEKFMHRFDKRLKKITNNKYYRRFLFPVLIVHFETLNKQLKKLKLENNGKGNSLEIVKSVEQYMQSVILEHNLLNPIFNNVFQTLLDVEGQVYRNDSGVFQYNDSWKKGICKTDVGSREAVVSYHYTSKENARIRFCFQGNTLKILAGVRRDFSENIEVNIDGEKHFFSTREYKNHPKFVCEYNQTVFEVNHLDNKIHDIEIKVKDPKMFVFNGIETDREARVYHLDEVMDVRELKLGKRIRCHYQATFNRVGTMQNLGKATSEFIPPESTESPNGDFYFVMVDEAKQILIADRNIQRHISWVNLEQAGIATEQGVRFEINNEVTGRVRLMTGGHYEGDTDNEWDDYLNNPDLLFKANDLEELWNAGEKELTGRVASWTLSEIEIGNKAMRRTFLENQYISSVLSTKTIASANSGYRPLLKIENVSSN